MAKRKQQQNIYNDYDRDQVLAYLKKQKAKKRKRRRRVIFVILVIGLIIAFFVSDYSRLQTITVSGNNRVSSEEIITASKIKLHQDYTFFKSMDAAENAIKKTSLIKDAKVTKDLFGHVKIKVVEADPIGQCTIDNILYVVDETGRVTKDEAGVLTTYVQRCPKLNGFDYDRFAAFAKEFAKIPAQVVNQISDINYAPENLDDKRCEFIMDDGKILYLRYDDMAVQLKGDNYALKMEEFPDYKYYDFVVKYVYVHN